MTTMDLCQIEVGPMHTVGHTLDLGFCLEAFATDRSLSDCFLIHWCHSTLR